METFTSVSGIDRIAALQDPVVRNLQITQSYHEISQAMAARTGACANWCTFATWASRQAGQTIRREDLANALNHHLQNIPELTEAVADIAQFALAKGARLGRQGIARLVWETVNPTAAMDRASAAVARGNRKVFAEIGREFARFLDTCLPDSTYNAAHLDGFCAPLKPGDPPNGQRYLRQAFARYYQALFEPDPKAKAELILLANIEIGFHEQTRLQPEIAEALEASVEAPDVFKRRLLDTLLPGSSWVGYLGGLFTALSGRPTPLDQAINRFALLARRRIRLFLTNHLMELGFQKGVRLRLGRDLQARFPGALTQLANADLITQLKKIDSTPDSLSETGAIDWADLPDRLHFIADLFRSYQETAELLAPPFQPEQVAALKAGRRPEGAL